MQSLQTTNAQHGQTIQRFASIVEECEGLRREKASLETQAAVYQERLAQQEAELAAMRQQVEEAAALRQQMEEVTMLRQQVEVLGADNQRKLPTTPIVTCCNKQDINMYA